MKKKKIPIVIEGQTFKIDPPQIFPITLDYPKELVDRYAAGEFYKSTRDRGGLASEFTDFSFYVTLLNEEGDTEFFVHYSYDIGVIAHSGPLFKCIKRPFNAESIQAFIKKKKWKIAEELYYHKKDNDRLAEIMAVEAQIFK